MRTLFAVTEIHGPAWDASKPLRAQARWTEHAEFMNHLAAEGFVILGGPLGDGREVLLVVAAADAGEITSRLQRDPWMPQGLLPTKSIQPRTILLDHDGQRKK